MFIVPQILGRIHGKQKNLDSKTSHESLHKNGICLRTGGFGFRFFS